MQNNEKIKKIVKNTDTGDKNKIKREVDAGNKAKLAKKYSDAGFIRAKVYFGKDTYKKLEEIYRIQQKRELDFAGRKEIDSMSRVISFCINEVYSIYRESAIKAENDQLPNILPAVTPDSQQLYDLYQVAHFLEYNGFNPYDIIKKMKDDGYPSPNTLALFGRRNRLAPWTKQQVEDLLNIEILNKDIRDLNESKSSKK